MAGTGAIRRASPDNDIKPAFASAVFWPPGRPCTTKAPRTQGFRECAEEDSNLHPVIPDQALNLVTRVSDPSYASRTCRMSADLDGVDGLDDLDVATDVATGSRVRELDP